MVSQREFEESLNHLEDCIDGIGDEVDDKIFATNQEEEKEVHIGFRAKHGSYAYDVYGVPEWEYFDVKFSFSVIHNIGRMLDDTQVDTVVEGQDTDENEVDTETLAGLEIMERMSPQLHEEFKYHLSKALASTDVVSSLNSTESGAITGFEASRKIFPYAEDFQLAKFNHSVQTVVNTGHAGVQFVAHALDLDSYMTAFTDGDDEPRYFH